MSPYLFDELSNMLNSAGIGCHIHKYCTNHVFYADDICVIALSPIGLQGLLNICAKFGLVNDVEYNPIKSLCMVFKPRGFNLKCPDIYMNVNKLAYVKEAKYLGVRICNDLKDDGDILRHLRNFYARSNSIMRKFTTVPWVLNMYETLAVNSATVRAQAILQSKGSEYALSITI